MYEVIFYEDENGNSDIFDYFQRISHSNQKQDKAIYVKMQHQINLLRVLGTTLHAPQAKQLKGLDLPLWELRPMPERVFYGVWQGNKFVLLSHYTKKKNKTDPKAINRALVRLDDWYQRKGR